MVEILRVRRIWGGGGTLTLLRRFVANMTLLKGITRKYLEAFECVQDWVERSIGNLIVAEGDWIDLQMGDSQ